MKILIVPTSDWVGHPFPSRLHHIFEYLSKKHEIHVVRFSFYPNVQLNTSVTLHDMGGLKKNNLAFYYTFNAPNHYKRIRELIDRLDIDYVVISNLLSGYVAAKALKGQACGIFDLSDFFPVSGAGYYFSHNSLPGKMSSSILDLLLKKTMRKMSGVVTCSHALQSYVLNSNVKNSVSLSNGVDDIFLSHNRADNSIRETYDLDDSLTIGYLGSVEFWLDMLPLLHAVKRISKTENIKLFLVGSGLRTTKAWDVWNSIKKLKIQDNVVWLKKFVPYQDVPKYINAMDICTIPFDVAHPVAYYSAPNKLWEYLALGKSVITTPIPEPLIQAGPYINVVNDSSGYEKVINDYIKHPDVYMKKSSDALKLVKQNSWSNIANRYEEFAQSLI